MSVKRYPQVVLLGINYSPEVTGIAPYNAMFAEWLAARGWQVEVVTTFPYYPAWRKLPRDEGKVYLREEMDGVIVHRVWHYVPKSVTALRRILHEASFLVSGCLGLFSIPRADLVVVVSPPLPLGLCGSLYRWIHGTPCVFHVQDLQPDAAVELGMISRGPLARLLFALESFVYGHATMVSGISAGMLEAFEEKGVKQRKLLFFPNPVEFPERSLIPDRGRFRQGHGIAEDTFLVSYSGNLGVKQGLGQILDAAERLLEETGIQFVICGDGAMREILEREVRLRGLTNVAIFPLLPLELYRGLLVDSDLCLVTQQAHSGAAFFPSKLLSIMALSRPVLAVADAGSAVGRMMQEEECGLLVPPDDCEAFSDAVRSARNGLYDLYRLGQRGHAFVSQFRRREVLARIERKLRDLVEDTSGEIV